MAPVNKRLAVRARVQGFIILRIYCGPNNKSLRFLPEFALILIIQSLFIWRIISIVPVGFTGCRPYIS